MLTTFLILAVAIGSSSAQTFSVTNFSELQDAFANAVANGQDDTIQIAPGLYNVTTTLAYSLSGTSSENFALTIEGAGAGSTILDGANARQIMNIYAESATDDNAVFTISGITFQNGLNGGQAAGLSVHSNQADITVQDCIFTNNVSTGSSYGDGGAVRARSQNEGVITISGNTFSGNAGYYGGGVWAISYWNGIVVYENNRFIGNNARHSYGGAYGFSTRGSVSFTHNTFQGNSATYSGGGAWADTGTSTSQRGFLVFTDNVFSGNSVSTYDGGGAYVQVGSGNTVILNNTFYDNTAQQNGGGLYVKVDYWTEVSAFLANNITWGNTATGAGADIYVADKWDAIRQKGSPVTLLNNLYTTFTITNGNNLTLNDNITDQGPQLTSDLHLTDNSPCLDAGTDAVPDPPGLSLLDIDGNARVLDGDGNGSSIVDIGADEYFVPDPGDIDGNGVIDVGDLILSLKLSSDTDEGESYFSTADVNDDNKVGVEEALFILQKLAGLR
jgi:hypothetical protein